MPLSAPVVNEKREASVRRGGVPSPSVGPMRPAVGVRKPQRHSPAAVFNHPERRESTKGQGEHQRRHAVHQRCQTNPGEHVHADTERELAFRRSKHHEVREGKRHHGRHKDLPDELEGQAQPRHEGTLGGRTFHGPGLHPSGTQRFPLQSRPLMASVPWEIWPSWSWGIHQ